MQRRSTNLNSSEHQQQWKNTPCSSKPSATSSEFALFEFDAIAKPSSTTPPTSTASISKSSTFHRLITFNFVWGCLTVLAYYDHLFSISNMHDGPHTLEFLDTAAEHFVLKYFTDWEYRCTVETSAHMVVMIWRTLRMMFRHADPMVRDFAMEEQVSGPPSTSRLETRSVCDLEQIRFVTPPRNEFNESSDADEEVLEEFLSPETEEGRIWRL